ncbi:MAG: glycerol-3-phosphate 1-O-acyltransferase PlsY [Betaproteobacteria bacterium]
MVSLLCAIAAYLIGSISFAVVASRIFGLPDPRTYGSGNPGATNVLRSGRKAAAAATLIGDTAKGFAAVAIVRWLAPALELSEVTVAVCAVAVFLGHLYPVFFRFKGGKGVATALGVILAFDWTLALLVLGAFIAVALLLRFISLASIAAAVVAAIASWWALPSPAYAGAICAIALLIVWRHRGNVRRLLSGSERRLTLRRSRTPPPGPAL